MYFEKFPYTFYSLDDLRTVQFVQNWLLRVKFTDELKTKYALYDEYDILDGETPEIIADRFYNNPQYHWIILLYNDILDPRFEWPLSVNNLLEYVRGKYGADQVDGIHHYENAEGFWVNSNAVGAIAVTNLLYEDRVNEEKRRIKILKPQYIETVIREFVDTIETAV